jgi:TolB-like protein/cytochrome c-type biogenesis protein CcmH/NrfG
MREFLQRLKERKLVQWTIAYIAAAFALLQGIDIVAQQFGWPEGVRRGITLALMVGFFVTLVLAWYHGERGTQRVTGTELLILALLLAIGGGLLWQFAGASRISERNTSSSPNGGVAETSQVEGLTGNAPPISGKSIAVLPFENLSDDKSTGYFADGIQDEILTRLASIADLKVISRTSTAKYKSKPEDLKTVSQQLGVANVLEGSVQKVGDQVRVNVQLIDARADSHLWAKSYDGDAKNIFVVETEVSQQVADALQAKLSPVAATAIATAPTNNSAAYDLFLRGEYEERRAEDELDRAAFDRAKTWYEQAIAADPAFALALARLVENRMQWHWFMEKLDQAQLESVKAQAERAITLAPNLAQTYVSLGVCHYYGYRDYERALSAFRKAMELQPNNSSALEYSGYVHRRQGKWEQCLKELQQALERDPRNAALAGNLASTYGALRMWKEADDTALLALKVDPHASDAMGTLLTNKVTEHGGDIEEALRVLDTFPAGDRLTSSSVGDVVSIIGTRAQVYLLARDFDSARKVWDMAEKEDRPRQLCAQLALDFLQGKSAEAKAKAAKAKPLLEQRLREVPDDILVVTELGWVNLALGEQSEALKFARQASEILSPERDALFGPATVIGLAEIQAWTGDGNHAIASIRHLLSIPAGNVASIADLKMNPVWNPIRNDPRFQELLTLKEHVGP